jgi:hypothetical protein
VPTATKKTNPGANSATEPGAQLGERLTDARRRAGNLYLDNYGAFVDSVTAVQLKLADRSKNQALQTFVATQVDVTRQLASAYKSAARALII